MGMNEAESKAKTLAEKLTAFLLEQEKPEKTDLSAVLARLDEMNARFERIENELAAKKHTVTLGLLPLHPSQEKFQIAEASDIFLPNSNEKACRFEPDKPCDHCSMCSSRGY